ncbi:hypothetical protein DFH06DRAFT_1131941 [Mycena polygramma]|nr:hypothetical protein DFH06DRAFT_1131941 [Mycena polygramma]
MKESLYTEQEPPGCTQAARWGRTLKAGELGNTNRLGALAEESLRWADRRTGRPDNPGTLLMLAGRYDSGGQIPSARTHLQRGKSLLQGHASRKKAHIQVHTYTYGVHGDGGIDMPRGTRVSQRKLGGMGHEILDTLEFAAWCVIGSSQRTESWTLDLWSTPTWLSALQVEWRSVKPVDSKLYSALREEELSVCVLDALDSRPASKVKPKFRLGFCLIWIQKAVAKLMAGDPRRQYGQIGVRTWLFHSFSGRTQEKR